MKTNLVQTKNIHVPMSILAANLFFYFIKTNLPLKLLHIALPPHVQHLPPPQKPPRSQASPT